MSRTLKGTLAVVVAAAALGGVALYLLREGDSAGSFPPWTERAAPDPATAVDGSAAASDARAEADASRPARPRGRGASTVLLDVAVKFDDGAPAVGAKLRLLADDEDADAEPEPDDLAGAATRPTDGPGRPGGGRLPAAALGRSVTTGTDGRATLVRARGAATRMRVDVPGAPRVVAVAPPDATSFDVVVTSEPALRGNALTDDGPLVAPAPFSLVLRSADGTYEARAEIGADGSYVFRGLRPGPHRLALDWRRGSVDEESGAVDGAPEVAFLRFDGTTRAAGATTEAAESTGDAADPEPPVAAVDVDVPGTVDVRLIRLGVVRGRLVGRDGSPRGGRAVRATFVLAGDEDVRRSALAVADRDGRFRAVLPADGVRGFPRGARTSAVHVVVAAHGGAPTALTVPGDASRGLDLGEVVVDDPAVLRFLVADQAGAPIAGAQINERRGLSTFRRSVRVVTNDVGRADAPAPAAAVPLRFVARADGFADREFTVEPSARTPEAPPVRVVLARRAVVVVRLRSGACDELAVVVRAADLGWSGRRPFDGAAATVDDVPSGAALTVSLADRAGPLDAAVETPPLKSGERRTVLMDAPPEPCFVTGFVRRPDGGRAAASYARVLGPPFGAFGYREPLDQAGRFRFPPFYRRGAATVRIEVGALFPEREIELTAGRVDLEFVALPTRIARLTVEDAAGAVAPRRDYAVEATAAGRRVRVRESDGRWTTARVPADAAVTFDVRAGGAERRVVAPPGQDDVAVRLPALCDVEIVAANPRPVGVGLRVEIRGVDDAALGRRLVRWLPPQSSGVRFRTRLVAGTFQVSATVVEYPDDGPPVSAPLGPPRRIEAAPDRVASAEW